MADNAIIDSIPDNWEATTLGEVCRRGGGVIQTGPFGSQLHASDYVPVGIPSIMPVNIGDNRICPDGISRITEADANRLKRHRVRPGDIIYSRRGDIERRALVRSTEDGWLCGTGCLMVRLGEGVVDPLFASYYLGHPVVRAWIVRHAVGATMPNLNTAIMEAVPIIRPPLDEQRAIAHILGTLDDKIELNRRMNETLEGIARAIFKSWFVDFDPVRAKADGRQPPGMDADSAALFPDRFQDSPLGKIPEGWSAGAWGEICTLEYGKSLRGYENGAGEFVVYGTNGPIGRHSEPLCKSAGIVIGRKGAYRGVHYSPRPFFVIDTAFYLKPTIPIELHWAFLEILRADINGMDSGSAIPSTSREDFYKIPVVLPETSVLERFGFLLEAVRRQQLENEHQSTTLSVLRDSLLPKLLSGEIRVSEVEGLVEA